METIRNLFTNASRDRRGRAGGRDTARAGDRAAHRRRREELSHVRPHNLARPERPRPHPPAYGRARALFDTAVSIEFPGRRRLLLDVDEEEGADDEADGEDGACVAARRPRARGGIRGTPRTRRRRARRRCRRRSSTRPAGSRASVSRVPRSESTRLHLGLDGPDVRLAVLIDRTSEAALARHDLGRAKVLVGVEEDEARTPRGLRGRRTRRRAAMCCRVERRAAMCCWSAARGVFRRRFFTWWTASERAGAWKASTAPAARSAMRARTLAMVDGLALSRQDG